MKSAIVYVDSAGSKGYENIVGAYKNHEKSRQIRQKIYTLLQK